MNAERNVRLVMPTSWSEVSIRKFQEIIALQNNEGIKNFDKIINHIAILADADPADVKQIPMVEMRKISEVIKFTDTMPEEKLNKIIEVKGKKYGFVNNLSMMSVGEWIDIEENTSDNRILEKLNNVMAVLYRPLVREGDQESYVIEDYDGATMPERSQLFADNMSIEDCYGAALFFSRFALEFMNSTPGFSPDQNITATTTS